MWRNSIRKLLLLTLIVLFFDLTAIMSFAYMNLGNVELIKSVGDLSGKGLVLGISTGQNMLGLNQYQVAESYMRQAIKWDPRNTGGYLALGRLYFLIGEFSNAIELLERATRMNSSHRWALFMLGNAYEATGNENQAVEYWRASRVAAPMYVRAGLWYAKQKEWDSALRMLQLAVLLNPESDDAYAAYKRIGGILLYNKRRERESVTWFERALQIRPDDAYARAELAEALLFLHNYRRAEAEANLSLSLHPTALAHRVLGSVYFAQGLTDMALSEYEIALSLAPDDYSTLTSLAEVYMKKGDLLTVQRLLMQVLETNPYFERAKQLLTEAKKHSR